MRGKFTLGSEARTTEDGEIIHAFKAQAVSTAVLLHCHLSISKHLGAQPPHLSCPLSLSLEMRLKRDHGTL